MKLYYNKAWENKSVDHTTFTDGKTKILSSFPTSAVLTIQLPNYLLSDKVKTVYDY